MVSPDILQSIQDALGQALLTAALAAIATLIAIQIIKIPIRSLFHFWMMRSWLSRQGLKSTAVDTGGQGMPDWLFKAVNSHSSVGLGPIHFRRREFPSIFSLMPFAPTDLFLKKIQNLAQRALERPSLNEDTFPYFAADAAFADVIVTYYVDAITQNDPKFLEQLTVDGEPATDGAVSASVSPVKMDESIAAAIAAAQDNVSTSVERSLDDLQIQLIFWWPIVIRLVVILVAVGLLFFFIYVVGSGQMTTRYFLTISVIGVAAGYLASFTYDLLSLLSAFRPRSQ